MKFIVKGCPKLVDSIYASGREEYNECGNSVDDEKCQDVKLCPIKEVVENLIKVVESDVCSRCDGCGYEDGCMDSCCGTYQAYKSLEVLKVKVVE